MIDYDFYVNTYLGTAIGEKNFPAMAIRAAEALNKIRRRYQVTGDEMSVKMALCALAEVFQEFTARRPGVKSAAAGSVSVHYENSESLDSRLLNQARIYLDIYRGAGV